MRPFPISAPELQRRRVLFAIALTDPFTGQLVSSGVRVSVDQLAGKPIVNRSGHFVWLAEGNARPTTITVTPEGAPYEPQSVPADPFPDPPPDDPDQPTAPVKDGARRQVIVLRPTAAYPFPDGAIVVRGRLQETAAANAPAVPDVSVMIEGWAERPPPPKKPPPPAQWISSFAVATTDTHGEFAAAITLPAGARAVKPDGKDIKLRLRFTRGKVERAGADIVLPPEALDHITVQRNTFLLGKPIAWDGLQAP